MARPTAWQEKVRTDIRCYGAALLDHPDLLTIDDIPEEYQEAVEIYVGEVARLRFERKNWSWPMGVVVSPIPTPLRWNSEVA
jgi:hypothetical protein